MYCCCPRREYFTSCVVVDLSRMQVVYTLFVKVLQPSISHQGTQPTFRILVQPYTAVVSKMFSSQTKKPSTAVFIGSSLRCVTLPGGI